MMIGLMKHIKNLNDPSWKLPVLLTFADRLQRDHEFIQVRIKSLLQR
jgi:hypothetical protein